MYRYIQFTKLAQHIEICVFQSIIKKLPYKKYYVIMMGNVYNTDED